MMIAAAVCPHPPLLITELLPSGSRPEPVVEVSDACVRAVQWLLRQSPDLVVVIGGGEATQQYGASTPFFVDRYARSIGISREREAVMVTPGLPLSLGIGARLLDEAGWDGPRRFQALSSDRPAEQNAKIGRTLVEEPGRTALLVMGDGSARRGPKAPGYLDPRAASYDDQVTIALGKGDAEALLSLDEDLAVALLVQGRAAWQALAGAAGTLPGQLEAELLYAGDPYGVQYIVSTWQPAPVR
ncbi:hypothetical protein [Arthrobacter sp. MMS18-M83]|uniref:hypothetical protein n=1 Tax=Arthrobacter sp. MMS18-M83 TaxID=2996261 RepID=UPI00227B3A13|nr:hypothetical protein [Arthrobacter sp. MMS18-M83]WAH97683.1 hypothetical protein OW521_01925 [Arthrobacter sp. MMS18-M83]